MMLPRPRTAIRIVLGEVRDFPATILFSLAWIVVFVAMVCLRMQENPAPTWWRLLVLGVGDGHRFGDLTLADLAQGQYWRLVTSTFVHYSVIHIVLNLLAFYLLGSLLESWYGTPQFVLIYGLTGAVGNLISALIRSSIGAHPLIHSGGGSVVIMGLIGLCGVVGFRSASEREHGLGWQMSKALGMTGLLGVAFPRYIDNWGHAGGAISGLPLGLLHGRFLRNRGRPSAWGMGMAAVALIVACALAQASADRREAGVRRELAALLDRRAFDAANRSIRVVGLLGERALDPRVVVEVLGKDAASLGRGPARGAYQQAFSLAVAALSRKLTEQEQAEFDLRLAQVSGQLLADLAPYLDKGATRGPYLGARAMVLEAQSRVLSDPEKDQLRQCIAPLAAHIQRELAARVREYWRQNRERPKPRTRAA
jgi:membrane associated rhomboid family serine protease